MIQYKCLCFLQTLTTLNLEQNDISDVGVKYIADILQENTVILFHDFIHRHLVVCFQTITTLNLQNNPIGDIGAQQLAHALSKNTVSIDNIIPHHQKLLLILELDDTSIRQ
jgi:Ran GTPase-activating protein (RanGAP) involved in mRNA processing and transport